MTNYNKMSKKDQKNETQELIEKIDEIIPPVAEVEESVEPISEEPVEVESIIDETHKPEPINGVVSDCDQLYVRSEASTDSEPLGVINCDTKVQIYESESTDDFYSVCTETGLEGFCMKKFISITD